MKYVECIGMLKSAGMYVQALKKKNIQQLANRLLKAHKTMSKGDFRKFIREEATALSRKLPAVATDEQMKRLGMSPLTEWWRSPELRAGKFPRYSVFRMTKSPLRSGFEEMRPRALKYDYRHVGPIPDTGPYGTMLQVFNAKKVPGALSGKLMWFGNRGAEGVFDQASDKFWQNPIGLMAGARSPRAKLALDTHSRDWAGGAAARGGGSMGTWRAPGYETLVDTRRVRPSHVYGSIGLNGDQRDITPLFDYIHSTAARIGADKNPLYALADARDGIIKLKDNERKLYLLDTLAGMIGGRE